MNTHRRLFVSLVILCSLSVGAYSGISVSSNGCATISDFSRFLPYDTIPQPDIKFEESVFDFGEISRTKKTKRTHSFVFENTGKANLIILHAASGCGCTVPKFTKEPVKPGEKGKIDVTFNAKDRPLGSFAKSVTIYINSVKAYVRIFIKGVVVE